jgi:hypothetical protein
MRHANLGNMFAPLLASGRINQLHAQTPSPKANAKIGKVFHETCRELSASQILLANSKSSNFSGF